MSTVNLTLVASALSVNTSGTVEQFHQDFVAAISSSTTSSNVMLGQVGGSAPVGNLGPWFNATTWFAWNGSKYIPATLQIGDDVNQITLAGAPSANRTITFPDKSGTVALTSDVNRATVYPTPGATTTIDWSLSNSFAIPLNQNTTISNINSTSGQEIQIAIYNGAGLSYTVTWGADVQWALGVAPTQTVGGGPGHLDIYRLVNMNGKIYGRVIQGY